MLLHYHCCEEKVVGEKLHVYYFEMFLKTVDFETRLVIDIHEFLLGDSKKRLIVKPPYSPNRFLDLNFRM